MYTNININFTVNDKTLKSIRVVEQYAVSAVRGKIRQQNPLKKI